MAHSEELRQRGNKMFQMATQPGLNHCLSRGRLMDARHLYMRAKDEAVNDAQNSSCSKNLAACCYRLAGCEQENRVMQTHFFAEGFKHSIDALEAGESCRPRAWLDACINSFLTAARDSAAAFSASGTSAWLGSLQRVFDAIPASVPLLKLRWCTVHARLLVQRGITVQEEGGDKWHNDSLRLLREANRPVHLGLQIVDGDDALAELAAHDAQELQDVQQTMMLNTCTCESVQARLVAEQMLHVQLRQQEQPNMDMVWVAVDKFKEAIILSKGVDLEAEAMAASALGRAFDRVLLARDKASFYFHHCMRLAEALKPKLVTHLPWYQVASQALQRFQREAWQRDARAEAERLAPILQELSPELQELRKHSQKGAHHLLQHIYTTHPPKNQEHVLSGTPNADNTKELLKQAIRHYHPDKQQSHAAQHGQKWVVLCQEIVKELNVMYQMFK